MGEQIPTLSGSVKQTGWVGDYNRPSGDTPARSGQGSGGSIPLDARYVATYHYLTD
jgi:hypothetical protein